MAFHRKREIEKSKQLNNNQNTLKNKPLFKKMSFFSSIMMVIGSSVGAGIFIKNWNILNNTQGALFYAILA
jgi:hypothetical protein